MYDLLIIGSGPGGMTAAVYGSRAGLKTAMIEKAAPGGQLINTNLIENYTAFKSINGYELANLMFEHSTEFGAEYKYGNVIEIKKNDDNTFTVVTDIETVMAKAVIIATGTQHKKLGLEREQELEGRGISYCAVCDGAFYKDRDVLVVGGGDSAFEEAIYLTNFANKVDILIRNKARATKHTIDEASANDKINIHYGIKPIEYLGDINLEGVIVETQDGSKLTMDAQGLFPYIGATPNSQFVNDDLKNEQGYILVNDKKETKVSGLYAIGDVTSNPLRQVVVATGDGAIAAQNAFAYIKTTF